MFRFGPQEKPSSKCNSTKQTLSIPHITNYTLLKCKHNFDQQMFTLFEVIRILNGLGKSNAQRLMIGAKVC